MFTHTYFCVILCISLWFTSYGDAFRFKISSEGNYLSQLVQLLNVIKINDVGENEFMKTPNNDGNSSNSIFNVIDYGAKGDWIEDDTKAFEAAWTTTCEVKNGIMLVPSGFSFLVQTITFNGDKCQSNLTLQVDGEIVAPSTKTDWKSIGNQWILFTGLYKGLTIRGKGVIDGRGQDWWKDAKLYEEPYEDEGRTSINRRPRGIVIENSQNVTVAGITVKNTPEMHLFFTNCQYVKIFNFTASSPGDSPNTDGIHLSRTKDVQIYNSTLACGDDCVSIQNGCSNVTISNVHCGPGHGFSIGSLGYMGTEAYVSNIGVYNSTATNTSNGVRIKSWETGTGSAQNMRFENIIMKNVTFPIIIDQYYCNGHEFCSSTGKKSAIAISSIKYKNITGTYRKASVALVCSAYKPCRGIAMADIDLNPSKGERIEIRKSLNCSNAYGTVLAVTKPPLDDCLLFDEAGAPAPAPAPAPEDMAYNELW